jgi:hypothetical protein
MVKAVPGPPGIALGIVAAAASTTFTQVKLAFMAAQKPPSFATGGIVPGTSFTGDNVSANVNSGEMILTQEQQGILFDIANNGNSRGNQTISLNILMDGTPIYEGLVSATADGRAQVDARGIVEN